MADIVTFLTARLDEDEQWAKWARTVIAGRWDCWEVVVQQVWACCDTVPNIGRIEPHLQYYADPDRALRDVAAKRETIKCTLNFMMKIDSEWGCNHSTEAIAAGRCEEERPEDEEIFRAMASVYNGHPDYDPAWRVE